MPQRRFARDRQPLRPHARAQGPLADASTNRLRTVTVVLVLVSAMSVINISLQVVAGPRNHRESPKDHRDLGGFFLSVIPPRLSNFALVTPGRAGPVRDHQMEHREDGAGT